ncbi:MAG: efflux RND transporter periplasmic adaptor subunit [Porticoccaceae bacterium]|nr:efflux RND transporter periplasmic adaptor subunit [Porticoccaceae bacterium]
MRGWIVTGAIVVVAAAAIYLLSRPERIEITLAPVERGTVERTVANTRAGTIEACKRSKLSLPIGGQINDLLVKEGDHVKEDQLLITIWNLDRKARVAEAGAAVNSALRERESQCVTARSDTREAKRFTRLAQEKLVAADIADQAQAKAEASAARCESMKAKELQAQANLEVAEAVLAQTELRAPFDGIVAEVTGKIGEYATPSPPGVPTPPAIDLITDDCHYISAPIDEVDASEIVVNLPVRVTLDAFRDREFAGVVTRISPYVLDLEKQARTVEVEANFVDLDESVHLLAGYSADMEIILETRNNTLRLPSELILDSNYVLVINASGYLEKRKITLGVANWRYTEITAGLVEGEKVVANIGAAGVVAGARAVVGKQGDDGDH